VKEIHLGDVLSGEGGAEGAKTIESTVHKFLTNLLQSRIELDDPILNEGWV
jgi:hypothetical protein